MYRKISEEIGGLVCDMDGVLYRGDELIPGAPEAVERLRSNGIRILFCTNNSRPTVASYVEKLAGFGIPARRDEVLTSGIVTAEFLDAHDYGGSTAILVGDEGIEEALRDVRITVVHDPLVDRADIVVVGWDPSFDWNAMRRAATAVRQGALFVGTNADATFPAPGGELWPGAGAILASIETASGRRARVMGKPHPPMMDAAEKRFPEGARVAVVGDRPDSDLAGADAKGWTKILVLTGITSKADIPNAKPQPDIVVASIADLS